LANKCKVKKQDKMEKKRKQEGRNWTTKSGRRRQGDGEDGVRGGETKTKLVYCS
jgi:hypothetical protein